MDSWRDMAANIRASRGSQDSAPQPRAANAQPAPLPSDISIGIAKLGTLRTPRITRTEIWPEVVADAQRLVREGWAAQALALGWSTTDLFGIGKHDDWEFEGLAVWLRNRPLIAIDEHLAVALDAERYAYFRRGGVGHGKQPAATPVLLWHFGRAT